MVSVGRFAEETVTVAQQSTAQCAPPAMPHEDALDLLTSVKSDWRTFDAISRHNRPFKSHDIRLSTIARLQIAAQGKRLCVACVDLPKIS